MSTFKMGAIGSIAVLLLSAGVAFAEKQATSTNEGNGFDDYRAMVASTTARIKTVREEAKVRIEKQLNKAEERMMDIKDKVKPSLAMLQQILDLLNVFR